MTLSTSAVAACCSQRLGEFARARRELLFELCRSPANSAGARAYLRSARTKLAAGRSALRAFARQGHLGTCIDLGSQTGVFNAAFAAERNDVMAGFSGGRRRSYSRINAPPTSLYRALLLNLIGSPGPQGLNAFRTTETTRIHCAAEWRGPLAARAHIVRSSDARPVNDTPCVGGQNHSEKSRQAASPL